MAQTCPHLCDNCRLAKTCRRRGTRLAVTKCDLKRIELEERMAAALAVELGVST
jgi:hypothetical protein